MPDRPPIPELFAGLFDDAAIFPPGNAPMPDAVRAHAAHRAAWYAAAVGPFICSVARLGELTAELTGELGGRLTGRTGSVDLSLTVPDGIAGLQHGILTALDSPGVRLCAVETPLGSFDPDQAARLLGGFAELRLPIYLEAPVARLDADLASAIAAAGFRLKLRTGGTAPEAFPSEDELAIALVAATQHGLVFKCTAGLHNAVRHRDAHTGFEHHGFLNVLVATAASCTGADVDAVAALLAERDGVVLAGRVREADAEVRRAFTSFGTCSITEPVEDLRALGLLEAS